MRITNNMRLNAAVSNLFNAQSRYNDMTEKIATQKKVNRASDDPIAAMKIINIRRGIAANEQYRKNIADSDAWISLTESTLSSAYDLLGKVNEIAVGQASGTATAADRIITSQSVQSLIDQLAGLANTKFGDRYLFSGSRNDVEPFSANLLPAIAKAQEAVDNTFKGTVTSSGTYTGEVNNTYAVKIIEGGTPAAATYRFSSDGGQTWSGPALDFGTLSTATEGSGTRVQVLKGSVVNTPSDTPVTATTIWNTGKVLKGNAANTAGGSPITSATVWNTIAGAVIQSGDTVTITGNQHDGTAVSVPYTITNAATGTVQDLLDAIQTTFGGTVTATIDTAGKITVTDDTGGNSQLDMTLTANNESGGALDFGTASVYGTNVQDNTSFTITGKKHDGAAVSGSYTIADATRGTFQDLLDAIQTTFGSTVTATIDGAGKITVTDTTAGDSQLEMTLTGSIPMAGGPVVLGDGVTLTFAVPGGETFGKSDIFYVNAIAEGYYRGNHDELSMTINRGVSLAYNITGAEAFTASGGAGVDVFKALKDLKNALDNNDAQAISGQLANLQNAQEQVLLKQALCGTTASQIEMAKNSLSSLDEKLTSLLSDAQDADLAEYAVRLSMQEIALQASYALAAKISDSTILNFLK